MRSADSPSFSFGAPYRCSYFQDHAGSSFSEGGGTATFCICRTGHVRSSSRTSPIAVARCGGRQSSTARQRDIDSRHQRVLVSSNDTMTRHAVPDLLPGTLDLLILRTLQTDSLHGWAIAERIQQISEGVLQVNRLALSRAPSARAQGLDRRRVGRVRAGPPREVLHAHGGGPETARGRSRRVGTDGGGHQPRDEAGVTP
jgi:hypothetical protein